ncbi:MAG: chemotaxis response regulator protein-glutamate methylesterase [Nakamurella sp.]
MISVVVADDSALVRRLVSGVLNGAPDIRVIGVAHNGAQAIERVAELQPDLLTLDIEMPVMDGLAAMRELHRQFPRLPVIMVSTLTQQGASITLDALAAGARDYVTKPTNSASLADSLEELRDQLVPRIRALTMRRAPLPRPRQASARTPPVRGVAPAAKEKRRASARPTQILAIGSSTGGPDALARVLGSIKERPSVPIVAVQHMPPVFTAMLAGRLSRLGPIEVEEAQDGQKLAPGVMYLAPGGRHLEVQRRGAGVFTKLHDKDPENYSRPSVDVLFRSVAEVYPGSAIGVILTGMGHDGRGGCERMGADGSLIVAQDQESSVVWGMPGSVAEAGLADVILSLDKVGPYLSDQLRAVTAGRRSVTGVA